MGALVRTGNAVLEGLIFGFTFAIGWIAAMLLIGAVMAQQQAGGETCPTNFGQRT